MLALQAVKHWFAVNDLLFERRRVKGDARQDIVTVESSIKFHYTVTFTGVSLPVSTAIKSLGVIIDSSMAFDDHVTAICKACNFHAWALRHTHHHLTLPVAQTLTCSIVGSRLDYCNSVLYGAPKSSIAKLQRVQNTLARIVLNKPKYARSTDYCGRFIGYQ